jgi:hypothetical protein
MKNLFAIVTVTVFSLLLATQSMAADALSADQQAKLAAKIKTFQTWGTDPQVVAAVKEYNASPSADAKAMTNDKWKGLNIMDPFVRSLAKNALAQFLSTKKDDSVTEAFVSGKDGGKVAFLAKTSSWNHKGKEKHDTPMTGKTWQGKPETDESTGKQQVQVAVPVLDGATPIGSLVIGVSLSKL